MVFGLSSLGLRVPDSELLGDRSLVKGFGCELVLRVVEGQEVYGFGLKQKGSRLVSRVVEAQEFRIQ